MRQLVGSLNWLSQGTRPDLSTITSMLARYQNSPTQKHIDAARYAIRYVKQTRHLGIHFDSNFQSNLQSFVHFPLDPLTATTDANWGSKIYRTHQKTIKCHFSSLDQSLATSYFCLVHYTGNLNASLSPLVVLLKPKYMPRTNASVS